MNKKNLKFVELPTSILSYVSGGADKPAPAPKPAPKPEPTPPPAPEPKHSDTLKPYLYIWD